MDEQREACQLCNATADVVTRLEYQGGKGYVAIRQCRDLPACWQRWDEANGLRPRAPARVAS